jgi:hypothetical protein
VIVRKIETGKYISDLAGIPEAEWNDLIYITRHLQVAPLECEFGVSLSLYSVPYTDSVQP